MNEVEHISPAAVEKQTVGYVLPVRKQVRCKCLINEPIFSNRGREGYLKAINYIDKIEKSWHIVQLDFSVGITITVDKYPSS